MVEKMSLVTLVGDAKRVDVGLKTLIETGKINPINADVGISVIRENYQEDWGVPTAFLAATLDRMAVGDSLETSNEKIDNLFERLNLEKSLLKDNIDLTSTRASLIEKIEAMHQDFVELDEKIETLNQSRERLLRFAAVNKLNNVDFDLSRLKDFKHFDVQLGYMNYEYEKRLGLNYDNINAIVLRAGAYKGDSLYFVISPKIMRQQTDNLLRSMHFTQIDILWDYMDYPAKMAERLRAELAAIDDQITALQSDITQYLEKHQALLTKTYTHLNLEATYDDVSTKLLHDKQHFICAFWVALNDASKIEQALSSNIDNLICLVHEDDVVKGVVIPTKLKNKWLYKPFELLVNLYGTPNYREVDPTGFLAVAYMFLFGAMFGDLGQGLVFWLAGTFLKRRPKMASIAGVLKRIGLSSMIFGIIYDSVFGIEHAISHFLTETLGLHVLNQIFLRPIENTNLMLLLSIAVGVIFLLISFAYSIYNKLKNEDIKEGVFGRNGINGLILFLALLSIGGMVYFNWPSWGIRLGVVVVGICVLLLVVREPLSNYLAKKLPLYHEGAGAYYTEAGFELLETFLAMLSNGISFIRVGAFALNHVGLFIAFQTIARMIGTGAGHVSMFILGNVLVIGLEGLIVFIQGLRLVYYEMFSKFYAGDGQPFVGMRVDMHYHND